MTRLIHILNDDEALGALEADLRRYYQVDVRGLFATPRQITYRQVITWIRHLDADSALGRRHLAGDVKTRSTKATIYDAFAAEHINQLRRLNFYYLSGHTDQANRPDFPDMIELA